jgi:hypothetical protein
VNSIPRLNNNGPYVVLDDMSTYSGSAGFVVYLSDKGERQLEETNDMAHVDEVEISSVSVVDLLAAYNKVHGTSL